MLACPPKLFAKVDVVAVKSLKNVTILKPNNFMKYHQLTPVFKSDFLKLIKQSQNIVLTGHISPDDDSISAILSLYHFISQKFPQQKLRILQTGQPITRYKSFLNYNQINFVDDLANHLNSADLLICLDGSQFHRFTNQPELLSQHPAVKICLDHHRSPIDKFDLSLVDPNAPASAQLIYSLISKNCKITPQLAEIFLLGIFGDTGTFNYLKPHQLFLLDIVKKLLKISQMEIQQFKSRYDTISTKVFEIIQEFIKNTQFYQHPNNQSYQTSFITSDFINQGSYTENDTSEASHIYASHYLRTIDGYHWGFVLRPKSTEVSLSLRSLPGSVNVRDIVERMNLGGGHDRAAGGKIPGNNPLDALTLMVNWIKHHRLKNS